jgi:hypothetical protein
LLLNGRRAAPPPSPLPSHVVAPKVHRDPKKPNPGRTTIAQPTPVLPRLNEHVLGEILGLMAISRQTQRKTINAGYVLLE